MLLSIFVFKMRFCLGCCSVNQSHFRYSTDYRRQFGSSTVRACAGFCSKTNRQLSVSGLEGSKSIIF